MTSKIEELENKIREISCEIQRLKNDGLVNKLLKCKYLGNGIIETVVRNGDPVSHDYNYVIVTFKPNEDIFMYESLRDFLRSEKVEVVGLRHRNSKLELCLLERCCNG